jgi:hypothetical protein
MNVIKCPGCRKTFDPGLSIKIHGIHQRNCTGLHLVGQKQIKKRIDNAQRRDSAKLAKIEGHTLHNLAEKRQELRNDPIMVVQEDGLSAV